MILGCGDTRASEDLHFPQVEATIYVHLVILVLLGNRRGGYNIVVVIDGYAGGYFGGPRKRSDCPGLIFSVDEDRPDGEVVCKKPAPPRAKWSLETLCPFLKKKKSTGAFYEPVYWYLPRKSPF